MCGYLRIALYLVTAAIIGILAYYPGLDATAFAPMALMDSQLFVYERDSVPWGQMGFTLLLSLVFTAAGFILTRLGEGSVVERLAKPMTRRDYVALGVLIASGLTLASTLMEQNQRDPIDFSSASVIRLDDPDVIVLYISDQYKAPADALAQRMQTSLEQLQATLALPGLPTVRLALLPSRDKHDIDYATSDGVFVSANWLEHDSYDNAILDSVIMHGVLSAQTNGRGVFEPYHWMLDGFTRWWVEQGNGDLDPDHRNELVARALLALSRDSQAGQLIGRWQLTADRFSYPTAEALAWAAMTWLEEQRGREAVIALATSFLTQPMGTTAFASLQDRLDSMRTRVEGIIDMPLEEFEAGWQQWLFDQRGEPAIERLIDSVPALSGTVETMTDSDGIRSLTASYQFLEQDVNTEQDLDRFDGVCIMKHDYIGPFDSEFDVTDEYEDITQCNVDGVAHVIGSTYASGDRVFVALDYEGGLFHQPVRLHAQRVYIP